jgi:hypothetical protein
MSVGSLFRLRRADAGVEADAKRRGRRRQGNRADQRVYLGKGRHTLRAPATSGKMRGDGVRFSGWERAFRECGKRRRRRVAIRA